MTPQQPGRGAEVFFDGFAAPEIDMLVMEPPSNVREIARRHGQYCAMAGGMDCRVVQYAEPAELEKQVRSILEFGKRYNECFEKYAYRERNTKKTAGKFPGRWSLQR